MQSVVQNLKLISKPPIQQVSLAMYNLPSQECILCDSLMTCAGEHNCIAYAINTANNLLQCMVALGFMQAQRLLLDPAIHAEFTRMKV